MTNKTIQFVAAVALQAVVVLAIVVFKFSVLAGGTEILLHIRPIDPRDPLRGDYVTFQYDISEVSSYLVRNGETVRNSDTVYVALRQANRYWIASGVYRTKPDEETLFIKGKVRSGGEAGAPDAVSILEGDAVFESSPARRFPGGGMLRIAYGIEEYFIPEGAGRGFSFWGHDVAARVAVDENGNAVLKQLYVDGARWPKPKE